MIRRNSQNSPEKAAAPTPPKTGDDTPLAAIALLTGLALAGLAWALRRKSS